MTESPERPPPRSAPGPEQPGFFTRHRNAALTVLGALVVVGFVYFVVPQIAGLGPTLRRLRTGDGWWLAVGVALEAVSIAGEAGLFRGVFSRPGNGIGWRISFEITLAGGAATKILATAGAGGIALTVWALRAAGLADEVATGMVCYEIVNYGVYMAALVVGGFGLWFGVFAGHAPVGVTLIPALFGLAVIVIVVAMLFADAPTERFLLRRADASHGRVQRWWRRAAMLPRSLQAGLRAALGMVGGRDLSLLWAPVAWGFDIGALWAAFHAFGQPPPAAVLVMGYYVGTLANTLPLPGGIGGVEGRDDRRVPGLWRQRELRSPRRSRVSHDLLLAAHAPGRDRLPSASAQIARLDRRQSRRHRTRQAAGTVRDPPADNVDSDRLPLDEAPNACRRFDERRHGYVKIVLDPAARPPSRNPPMSRDPSVPPRPSGS